VDCDYTLHGFFKQSKKSDNCMEFKRLDKPRGQSGCKVGSVFLYYKLYLTLKHM
jgi:hypothetical protein